MVASQRRRNIVALVQAEGSAKVSELARSLEVTEETIRRDLRALSDQGRVVRTHGGALAVDTDDGRADLPYQYRSGIDQAQKDAIAAAALAWVRPGQTIALDASSTAFALARRLPDEPLTVVTNSLMICGALSKKPQVATLCTGGRLDPTAQAFHGPDAERAVERYNIHCAFFSCRGVDPQRGLSEASDAHASIKRRLMDASQRNVLLADRSKLGLCSSVFFADCDAADLMITDAAEDHESQGVIEALRTQGLEVREVEVDGAARVDQATP